jgi:hypothetical protein
MNRTALLACVLPLLVLSAACNRSKADGAPTGQTTTSGAVAAATAPSKAQKLLGSWVAADGSGETLQITADTMTTTYTKIVGGKPLVTKYAVMKEEGNVVVVSASVDLGNGKSFAGDPQNLTLVDDDTLDKRNSINKSGNLFKRKK